MSVFLYPHRAVVPHRVPRVLPWVQLCGNLPALTGIRFFAAFYVVLSHALSWLSAHFALPGWLRIFLSNGQLAVALFFILSGFILAYTYEGQVNCRRDRVRFWEARFARIYPVYFLSLLLALPFNPRLTLGSALHVLFMIQAWNPWNPEWAGAWNYPAWSLSVEAFFYLCFPFIQQIFSRLSDRVLTLFIVTAALVCVLAHTPVQGLANWDRTVILARFLPLLRLPEFILGMGLGNRFLRRGFAFRTSLPTIFAAIAILVVLSLPIHDWVSIVVIPFGFLIYELADPKNVVGVLLSNRLMLLLGGASYSIYLLQHPFRDYVRDLSARAPYSVAGLATPATPILLVIFSILLFKLWEEPSRRAIRRAFHAVRVVSS